MTRDEATEVIGNVVFFIIAIILGVVMLWGYTHASQEDRDTIFWIIVTQPQE